MTLTTDIKKLEKSPIQTIIKKRLKEFKGFQQKPNPDWFSELCFCILTANSKAHTALGIQAELGPEGFATKPHEEIRKCIISFKHRFHNNKSSYIIQAREHKDIKNIIHKLVKERGTHYAREWLVENIKGLGYKEASHFLRNVGYTDIAILDRHILNLMADHGIIREKPKSLTPNIYKNIEKILGNIASSLNISMAELDLYMWYIKTGEVLK